MKQSPCLFCEPGREVIDSSTHAIAVYDGFPVSPGHALILPRRHVVDVWALTDDEFADCFNLVRATKKQLELKFKPDGYNIGVNCGFAGGQSVWHAHIHLIPRYSGDVANPRGGVRNVIPLKGNY